MSIGAANRGQLLITVTATLTCVAGARNYHRSVSAAPSPAVLARKVQAFLVLAPVILRIDEGPVLPNSVY